MDLIDDPSPGQNAPEFTVSEISGAIKRIIEDEFGRVRVRGEVGRVFKARSGHLYFDVKDDRNVLSCTTWKGQIASLSVEPEEGLEVVVTGKLTTFGAQSKYNMNVEEVAVAGQGALMAMLEKRKKALEAEGLFATERKQPLPYLPDIIGVVTSPSGAVIRDILHRLRERFPRKVLIWPVAVQGANCAPEVARAIEGFNALSPGGAVPRPDLIIVARGGGSIEDLWGFNEEIVARAAAASVIPLISAVGHETDTTLIDYVSDRRAPTPTAAAELAVPVRLELKAWVDQQEARLTRALSQSVTRRRQRLSDLSRILPRADALLNEPRQRLDRAEDALSRALIRFTERKSSDLRHLSGGLRPASLRARLASEAERLSSRSDRIEPGLKRTIARKRDALDSLAARLRPTPLVARVAQQKTDLERISPKLTAVYANWISVLSERVETLDRLRLSVGYQATLKRGYAVVRADEKVVTGAEAARRAGALEIEFQDGRVIANAVGSAPKRATKRTTPDQGSLF